MLNSSNQKRGTRVRQPGRNCWRSWPLRTTSTWKCRTICKRAPSFTATWPSCCWTCKRKSRISVSHAKPRKKSCWRIWLPLWPPLHRPPHRRRTLPPIMPLQVRRESILTVHVVLSDCCFFLSSWTACKTASAELHYGIGPWQYNFDGRPFVSSAPTSAARSARTKSVFAVPHEPVQRPDADANAVRRLPVVWFVELRLRQSAAASRSSRLPRLSSRFVRCLPVLQSGLSVSSSSSSSLLNGQYPIRYVTLFLS